MYISNLDDLLTKIEDTNKRRALSDNYLKSKGCSTRPDVGIGEYEYGIVTIPVDYITPYLKTLQQIMKFKNSTFSTQQITKILELNMEDSKKYFEGDDCEDY